MDDVHGVFGEAKGTAMTKRRITLISFAIIFLQGTSSVFGGTSSGAGEYLVKAAFLFHFAMFAEWPPHTFKIDGDPVTFCTLGEDPFGGTLETSVEGRTVGTHPIKIRHLKQIQEIQGCHILFIDENQKKHVSALLATLKDSPVLTVGETDKFAEQGGIIGFRVEEKKIAFDINLEAAERANVKISARLLSLAKNVIGKPRKN